MGGFFLTEKKGIPESSKCVKFVPFHQKKLPKGRNFTYVEDPGIYIYDIIYIYIIFYIHAQPLPGPTTKQPFFFLRVFLEIKARRPDVDERMEASNDGTNSRKWQPETLGKCGLARRCQMRTVTFCLGFLGVYDFPLNHQMTFFGLKHCECFVSN